MSTHRFLWNADIEGHTCANCGMTRKHATPEQYESLSNAIDAAKALAGEGTVWQSLHATGAPLFSYARSTGQGYVRVIHVINATGDIVQRAYQINGQTVDTVPATFRAFHQGYTVALRDALSAWAVNAWTVNNAEDNGECA